MSKKVLSVIAAVLVTGFFVYMPCFAKGPYGPPCDFDHKRPHPGCMHKAMQELDLSEDQQTAMDELQQATCDQIEPLVEQIIAVELHETLLAEEIDETEAAAKIAEVVDLKSRIGTIKLQSRMAASRILTAAQRRMLLEKVEECRQQDSEAPGRRRR